MMRSVIVAALLVFGGAIAAAQEFRKIVEIVDEMETSLRKTIAQEQTDRKADIAALRQEIDRLRESRTVPVATAGIEAGTAVESAAILRRLDVLEKRIDKTNNDVLQLTRAVSLLVQELKATAK